MGIPKANTFDDLVAQVCLRMTTLTGNVLGDKQRPMVEARLKRHLRDIDVEVEEYWDFWKENMKSEDEALVGLLTTHFTSFFREFLHFEYLLKELPQIVANIKAQGRNEIKILSAACSRGQEVWSLAMWLHHYLPGIDQNIKWTIVGTDIDQGSVEVAKNAVYHLRELSTCPRHLWETTWQRGKDDLSDWFKAKKVLREHCSFAPDNLLEPIEKRQKYDVILCRNVLIYFEEKNQKLAVKNLLSKLYPDGLLITGVSESLTNLGFALDSFAPSVYGTKKVQLKIAPTIVAAPQTSQVLKVLCIDDSSTVLTILKKLLTDKDFQVVGVAKDGAEGLKLIAELKPDVVTLDLHMPGMDGFGMIETGIARKIPIIVVSTVERQNASLVHPLFEKGVCDYIEKPTFENLARIGEELKQKLKMSWWSKQRGMELSTPPVKPSATKRVRANGRIILNAGFSDREVVRQFLSHSSSSQDEILVHIQGEEHIWQDWALGLKSDFLQYNLKFVTDSGIPADGVATIFFHLRGADLSYLQKASSNKVNIILEDCEWPESVRAKAHDIYPASSFVYMAERFLEGR